MRYAELQSRLKGIPEDKFVLHGSPHKVIDLEPRQTHYDSHKQFTEFGLYGTPFIEIALLYALIHESRGNWGWIIPHTTKSLKLFVHVFEGFSCGSGYVYVLNKKYFRSIEESKGQVSITRSRIRPVETLKVDAVVLQELIEKNLAEITTVDHLFA
jgi:hypothetical protein